MSKVFLCHCEDVTLEDFIRGIEEGYRDLESLKRYTGLGTGLCQGKSCLAEAMAVLIEYLGEPEAGVVPITPRPPLHPQPMKIFAGEEKP